MRLPACASILASLLPVLSIRATADDVDFHETAVRPAGDVDRDGTPDLMIADEQGRSVWVVSGKSRALLLELRSPNKSKAAPFSMDSIGDLDRDGCADLAVAWRTAGTVVYSGRDGHVVFAFSSGGRVAAARDVDADGTPDLLLSSFSSTPEIRGRVEVRSGRDGSVLFEKWGSDLPSTERGCLNDGEPDLFGESLAGVGDVNGDGHGDFAIGSPGGLMCHGAVELYSGKDGRSLARVEGSEKFPGNLGWSMRPMGDLNGDGVSDLLVGAIARYAAVYSGRDLRLIHRVGSRTGTRVNDAFASSLDRLGDINGDGIDDWIVGANESFFQPPIFDEGYAQVYSGKDAKLLRVLFESKQVGVDVCGLGDVDGDRVPDQAIACPLEGWVRVMSGKDGKLIEQIDFANLRESATKPR